VRWVIEPGFFTSNQVQVAVLIGALVAVVSAVVGVFTVMRGQSFAGHALTDVSAAGGSGAFLIGVNPVAGFVGFGVLGGVVMDLIGVRRVRGRDLATGTVLGGALGLAALFLHLATTSTAATGGAQQILFGSIFSTSSGTVPVVAGLAAVSLGLLAVVYRPLLLSSVSDEVAAARGVPIRAVGMCFMACLAVAVGLSAIAVGAILSTAMLVGPAATALRLTKRVAHAMMAACAIGIAGAWLGVLLAYDSYYWGASHQGVPVSFFIVSAYFVAYLGSGLWSRRRVR
jgi:zinc/manganese transport system permease protein